MKQHGTTLARLRLRTIAAATAVLFSPLANSVGAAAPAADIIEPDHATRRVYSVINLGPGDNYAALLNERGQAAYGNFGASGTVNGFFDGNRLYDIGSLGGGYTVVNGLNRYGMVVGESEDAAQHSNILGFYWNVANRMRALSGTTVSSAAAINDRYYIVGLTPAPAISARAIRWNPNGTRTALGPVPFSLSQASDINVGGAATGFTDLANGRIHASLWDQAGNLTDLGTLGGELAFGEHINDNQAVAGESYTASDGGTQGFFWSRNSGMVPINIIPGGMRFVSDLNNRNEVVGDAIVGEASAAYVWSLTRGVVPLPLTSAASSSVSDINNNGEMVGQLRQSVADWTSSRAVRWPGANTPIDLNTRLHRPPAGLILYAGAAINDDGVILAHSNAGLVMLRPGTIGTNAPVLGPMVGLTRFVDLGQDLALSLGFVDNNSAETHRATTTWTDGCPSTGPTLTESGGVGKLKLRHRFCSAGFHTVTTRVTDSGGRSTLSQHDFLVEDPAAPSVSGQGMLSNEGLRSTRRQNNPPLRFTVWAPIGERPAGNSAVLLSGPFHFRSEQVNAAAATGRQARLEGTGRLNGRPGYRFQIQAQDDGSADRLSVRIVHTDPATSAEVVDYDNSAPTTLRTMKAAARNVVLEGSLTVRN